MKINNSRLTMRSIGLSAHSGFTLVELVTVLAVMSILIMLAAPNYRDFVLRQRVKSVSYDFSSALVLARSEAIKRNAEVTIMPATGGWNKGWLVQSGDLLLSDQSASRDISVTGPTSLTYTHNGRLKTFAGPIEVGSATIQRCIKVSLSGMPTSKAGSC